MKKIMMLAAAAAAAAPTPLMLATPAYAGYNNLPAICKNYVASEAEPIINQGECISLDTSFIHTFGDGKNGNPYAVKACDYYAETDPAFFDALWDSKQQCMDEVIELGL